MLRATFIIFLSGIWTLQAAAQNVYLMPDTVFNAAMYNPWIVMGPIIDERLDKKSLARTDVQKDRQPGALTTRLAAPSAPSSSVMPAKMASHYPPQSRAEAERVFRDMLGKHAQLMKQLGVPADDVAAAIAAFLAGNYMAYREAEFPDINFKPLYQQMKGVIGGNSAYREASEAEKCEMFEQMAIMGTFMALTREALKQQPNAQVAANMKQAAKGYLEQFLKTDADRVQITANGLVLK